MVRLLAFAFSLALAASLMQPVSAKPSGQSAGPPGAGGQKPMPPPGKTPDKGPGKAPDGGKGPGKGPDKGPDKGPGKGGGKGTGGGGGMGRNKMPAAETEAKQCPPGLVYTCKPPAYAGQPKSCACQPPKKR